MKERSCISIDGRPCRRFHFVGVLGSGMSAIAQYLLWLGCRVSGSDRAARSRDTADRRRALEVLGCRVVEQNGSGVDRQCDAVVASTAIEDDNLDVAAARTLGIPLLHRADVLAALVAMHRTVAVAGTSGKSTVTALCFDLLEGCGRGPSVIAGADLTSLADREGIGNAHRGGSDLLVVEADESDGTLVKYQPHLSVFLNLSRDHRPEDEVLEMFRTLAARSGRVVVNEDDHACRGLDHTAGFGIRSGSTCRPDGVEATTPGLRFSMDRVAFASDLVGEYNLYNVLAALSVCRLLGCETAELAKALPHAGRLRRRFERIPTRSGIAVFDDFAHNPAKIEAVLRTAQALSPRVFALYQPHGFAPTRFTRTELIEVIAATARPTDEIVMLPIYYAGGTAQKDISSADIVADLVRRNVRATAPQSRDEALALVEKHVGPGDLVLSMGARDPSLSAFARAIADTVDKRP